MTSTLQAIVSSGSNNNGTWIRYADGTQICAKSIMATVSFTQAFGNWYETPNTISFGDWAMPFASGSAVIVTASTANRACAIEALMAYNETSAGNAYLMRPNNVANQEVRINLIAIGRWK